MTFKGHVNAGSMFRATFDAEATNQGTAVVLVSFANDAGNAGPSDNCVVAPGTVCTAVILPPEPGRLEVLVALPSGSNGTLTTRENTSLKDTDSIDQPTTWSYAVIP